MNSLSALLGRNSRNSQDRRLPWQEVTDLDLKTVISTKDRIAISAELRKRDNIQPGQAFDIERVNKGEYPLAPADPPKNRGSADTAGGSMPCRRSRLARISHQGA